MKWTKTPPTKPDWYWAGELAGPNIIQKTIVEVYLSNDGELLVYIDDGERHDLSWYDVWSDQPIPQPEEAEGDYHVPFEEFMEAVRNAGEANPEIAWLANNEEAARSVHRGLEQSFKHKGKFIGRFAEEAEGVE